MTYYFKTDSKKYIIHINNNRISIGANNNYMLLDNPKDYTYYNGVEVDELVFFRKPINKQISKTYRINGGFAGKGFVIYNDTTAAYIHYGSGVPIVNIEYGNLVKIN